MYSMYQNTLATNAMMLEESSVLMTPPKLAAYLGIGRNLTYQLLNEGIIKGFKIGN